MNAILTAPFGVDTPWMAALLLLIVGWLAAIAVRLTLSRFLELPIFNKIWQKSGFAEFLRKGQVSYSPGRFIGVIVYWVIILQLLLWCSKRLDVTWTETLSSRFKSAAPEMAAALFTLIIGTIIVFFIANFIMTVSRNAALPHARLFSQSVRILGVIIVAAIALEQLSVRTTFISSIFLLFFGAVLLGLALAFGLGCKDMARDAMEKVLKNLREQGRVGKNSDFEG